MIIESSFTELNKYKMRNCVVQNMGVRIWQREEVNRSEELNVTANPMPIPYPQRTSSLVKKMTVKTETV